MIRPSHAAFIVSLLLLGFSSRPGVAETTFLIMPEIESRGHRGAGRVQGRSTLQFSGRGRSPQTPRGRLNTLTIQIKGDNDDWQDIHIRFGRAYPFSCDQYDKIRVLTVGHDRPAEYDVSCQNRYTVYWDRALSRWDIAIVVPE